MPDRHVTLIPSRACQASCSYCFGPNRGATMPRSVLRDTCRWLRAIATPGEALELTFHGGEPLLAGREWYGHALSEIRRSFGAGLKLSIQSNLWLLDDAFCELFKEYQVSIGTSLDGPREINDRQRGEGYFDRTMAGIERARRAGLPIGVVCTFTQASAARRREVFDFFSATGLSFSLHEAVGMLGEESASTFAIEPEQHVELFRELFDRYLSDVGHLRVVTFDAMAQGLSAGEGALCKFANCLGCFFSIDQDGGIYPCNRFVPYSPWRMGFVQHAPTLEQMATTFPWETFRRLDLAAQEECAECPHLAYCRAGCRYTSLWAGLGGRDPYCPTYKCLFGRIRERALQEVFAESNMLSVIENGAQPHGLLHKGPLLQVMRNGHLRDEVLRRSRETIAAVALAVSDSPQDALDRLTQAGAITVPVAAFQSLLALERHLRMPVSALVNAYLHITYACNSRCSHCYAFADPGQTAATMPVDRIVALVQELDSAQFEKIVITGGEPLTHPQSDELLEALATVSAANRTAKTVLRTNLAVPLNAHALRQLSICAHQIVVSIDGDANGHDARRGPGMYARTTDHLKALVSLHPSAEIVLAATLRTDEIRGHEGDAVRALGKELGIGVRFKPVLPIGRARNPLFPVELDSSIAPPSTNAPLPAASCGLGRYLYVDPFGHCYPCYALLGAKHYLGNVFQDGLDVVLGRNSRFRSITVDSNRKCRSCSLRYLCGGPCRAWFSGRDPDSPPPDCHELWSRAAVHLSRALDSLELDLERWTAAGLPLPTVASQSAEERADCVRRHGGKS